jgi:hypothetical protein
MIEVTEARYRKKRLIELKPGEKRRIVAISSPVAGSTLPSTATWASIRAGMDKKAEKMMKTTIK